MATSTNRVLAAAVLMVPASLGTNCSGATRYLEQLSSDKAASATRLALTRADCPRGATRVGGAFPDESQRWWHMSSKDAAGNPLSASWSFPAWRQMEDGDSHHACSDRQGEWNGLYIQLRHEQGGGEGGRISQAWVIGNFREDKPDGEWIGGWSRKEPQALAFSGQMKDGEMVGEWTFDGPPGGSPFHARGHYSHGLMWGPWTFEDSQGITDARYVAGVLHGTWKHTSADGTVVEQVYFEGDILDDTPPAQPSMGRGKSPMGGPPGKRSARQGMRGRGAQAGGPGQAPGAMAGQAPGAMAGQAPGAMAGQAPGAMAGQAPGATSELPPGTSSGSEADLPPGSPPVPGQTGAFSQLRGRGVAQRPASGGRGVEEYPAVMMVKAYLDAGLDGGWANLAGLRSHAVLNDFADPAVYEWVADFGLPLGSSRTLVQGYEVKAAKVKGDSGFVSVEMQALCHVDPEGQVMPVSGHETITMQVRKVDGLWKPETTHGTERFLGKEVYLQDLPEEETSLRDAIQETCIAREPAAQSKGPGEQRQGARNRRPRGGRPGGAMKQRPMQSPGPEPFPPGGAEQNQQDTYGTH